MTLRSLARPASATGAPHDRRRTACVCPVDGLIRKGIGDRIPCARNVRRRPAVESTERRPCCRPQRDELGVLDPPAPGQLLDDELRVEQKVHLACPEVTCEVQGTDDAGVLRHVVGWDSEVIGDRRVGDGSVVAGIRPAEVVQGGTERGGSGIAARRAVGADDEAAWWWRRSRRIRFGLEIRKERVAQSGARSDPSAGAGVPWSTGSSTPAPLPAAPPPRTLLQTHWIGS